MDAGKIDSIIETYGPVPSSLIPILQDVQQEYNYLPEDVLEYVASRLGTRLSKVYHVATFYNAFSLKPRGKYVINVCTGTACHVKGAEKIIDELYREIGIKPGETTQDMRFTVQTVRCVGCCSLAPAMVVNKDTHGKVRLGKVAKVLKNYES
ncbi:MAG: NADH-quinone oxidoreductase subunit NuoE [Candidatus Tectomicrobia bacterium]|uniref:NADH-quinone oxidoreductase subunit NuoE n=1 Tax=Tectimicrobiota bacterium TaxID=2528274 RepID=A0A933GKN4_UNCTE|nr:NADH-quinone oxidoreductase subunit NuoE [Candidatus Tectomicrobia bacterium]